MIMGYVDGTEGTREEQLKAAEKKKKEDIMNTKRSRFFDMLIKNEIKNKPDRAVKNEFSC